MSQFLRIALDDLIADPSQPRKDFEGAPLQELAESIRALGVKTPISVRLTPSGETKYMIIAGERRWRASTMAGVSDIPAIVEEGSELSEKDIFTHQLTENLHRQDLNPVEKAEYLKKGIDRLIAEGVEKPAAQLASDLGVSQSWVSKGMAILKYSEEIRSVARNGKVRDYSLLRKLENLPNTRRSEAIELIDRGEFVAKTFFARKRYDSNKGKNTKITQNESRGSLSGDSDLGLYQLSLANMIKAINKTEFRFVLEGENAEWAKTKDKELCAYIDLFLDWLKES